MWIYHNNLYKIICIDRYARLMKNTYGKFGAQMNPSFSSIQRLELFKRL